MLPDLFRDLTSTARWTNQLSLAAPCQCFTSAGIVTHLLRGSSPGRLSPFLIIASSACYEAESDHRMLVPIVAASWFKVTFPMGRADPKGVHMLSQTVPMKFGLSNFSPTGKITLLLRSSMTHDLLSVHDCHPGCLHGVFQTLIISCLSAGGS